MAAGYLQGFATLCLWTGFGIGWSLGGPRVAQGPPKRGARAIHGSILLSAFICNKGGKRRVGCRLAPEFGGNRNIEDINRKGKAKNLTTEDTETRLSLEGWSESRARILKALTIVSDSEGHK